MNAEEFDEKFDADKEDVVDDLDLSIARRVNQEQKRISSVNYLGRSSVN